MSRRFAVGLVLSLLSIAAVPVDAQTGPPEIYIEAPLHLSTRHSVNPKIDIEFYAGGECLLDEGDPDHPCWPDLETLEVTINGGSNLAGSFTTGQTTATNRLDETSIYGANTFSSTLDQTVTNYLYAKICNDYGCDDLTVTVYINVRNPAVTIQHHFNLFQLGACEGVGVAPGAAFSCDAFVFTHGIPGYVSLGTTRGASVIYSTRSAASQLTIPFDVELHGDAWVTSVQAKIGCSDCWTYWLGSEWGTTTAAKNRRLALIKPESTQTGGYVGRIAQTLEVKKNTEGGVHTSSPVDTLTFFFERNSLTTPIARGWAIAGISRIYGEGGHAPGTGLPWTQGVLVTGGGGGAVAYFRKVSQSGATVTYGRPQGVFASLTLDTTNARWLLTHSNGVREHYTWVSSLGFGRLDSVVTVGQKTRFTYGIAAGGWPDSIVDTLGKATKFHYSSPRDSGFAALDSICAAAGANQRCTTFYYSTSPARVDSIKDPDGGKVTFGYSGSSPYLMTTFKPRGHGQYSVLYHGAGAARPSALVRPAAPTVDTLYYRAPQLAGYALSGGSSGSPAVTATDTAWGWVKQPAATDSVLLSVGKFGTNIMSRGIDGVVHQIVRNVDGRDSIVKRNGQTIVSRWHNTVGALTKQIYVGGDTTYVTYEGACGSETGYPCLPALSIVSRAPEGRDTTQWFYGGDELADSVFRGAHGRSHIRYTTYARVDSTIDHAGQVQRFTYEGTWGNVLRAFSDTLQACTTSCTTTRDSVEFAYDVSGRPSWVKRGTSGGRVALLRDRLARDTMVVDSAAGGGVIVAKTRFSGDTMVTVVDGKGQEIKFRNDSLGRVKIRTDALGRDDLLSYDKASRLSKWITRRGDSITYAYDSLSRLRTKYVQGDGPWTYGYNATHGALDTLLTPSADVYRTRDSRGRMVTETSVVSSVSRTVQYSYLDNGMVATLIDPWSGTYTFGINESARERTIQNPFSESYTLRYDTDGRLQKVVFPTGSDSLEYNGIDGVRSAGIGAEIAYEREPVTKGINRITWGSVGQLFGYDGYGRLNKDSVSTSGYGNQVESFTYDSAGNRQVSTNYKYDVTNALRLKPAIGGDSYAPGDTLTYDNAGNPTWWKNTTSGAYDSLFWDAENRLIEMKRFTSGGSLDKTIDLAYDGFGRRVKKVVDGTATRYVWDGWRVLAEADGSGNAVRQYTNHPEQLDFPLAMRAGGTTTYFHLDGQGSVYALTNVSGTRVTEYRYRAWGDRYVTGTGESVQSPFTYKGAPEDRETGLIYMRYRYYSPRLERFLNEDPVGLAGGSNLYQFVNANPANSSDPLGLLPWFAVWGLRLGGGILLDMAISAAFKQEIEPSEIALWAAFNAVSLGTARGLQAGNAISAAAKFGGPATGLAATLPTFIEKRNGGIGLAFSFIAASQGGDFGLGGAWEEKVVTSAFAVGGGYWTDPMELGHGLDHLATPREQCSLNTKTASAENLEWFISVTTSSCSDTVSWWGWGLPSNFVPTTR